MIRKSILTDMYNDGVALSQNIEAKGTEYKEMFRLRETKEEEFIRTLTKEQIKLFEEWKEAWFRQEFHFEDENYRQGFYLGVQITSEAFILKD